MTRGRVSVKMSKHIIKDGFGSVGQQDYFYGRLEIGNLTLQETRCSEMTVLKLFQLYNRIVRKPQVFASQARLGRIPLKTAKCYAFCETCN
jgi:hypothetical protein